MKKITCFFIAFIFGMNLVSAKPITSQTAKDLALTFFKQHKGNALLSATLAHTGMLADGTPAYFVFNINENDGFIIISADDAAHPVIGYSTKDHYIIPEGKSNIGKWLVTRTKEIAAIRAVNAQPDFEIKREWAGNFTSNLSARGSNNNSVTSVSPLCSSTWDQSGGGTVQYNNLCPGGSVTGCVATAMAQIMRFWSYPAHGTGSSSYTAGSYGTLSCNYGATTYNWSAMPLTSSNSNVALISYQAGVSVEMNYSPSGSGAYVITADDPICAQNSYVQYFGYDPAIIQGLYRSGYSDATWISMLENDLIAGRPIQYVGDDPTQGGHTWVCDGFDATNNFHMNWGWGGYDDGYYSINNLNTSSGFNPSQNHEALMGIQPMATTSVDAGVSAVVSPVGTGCTSSFTPVVTLKNFGSTTLTSCVVNYNIDGGSTLTHNWSGSLASGLTANVTLTTFTTTAGTHTLTSSSSNPNGSTDGNTANDQTVSTFNSNSSALALPLAEGLESSAAIPTGWTLYNPDADAAWVVSTTVAKTGSHSLGFNNCDGDASTDMTGRVDRIITAPYNFSSATSASLSFDVAYAVLTYTSGTYYDALKVYSSIDCGSTWVQIYSKSGTTLASAPTYTSIAACWAPASAADWRNDVTNISSLAGNSSVMFAFENTSAWGTWLYLDNINITSSTTGISPVSTQGFNIYPNPASTSFTIEGADHSGMVRYTIYNMSGQEVKKGEILSAANSFKEVVSVTDLSSGMYFVKLNDEKTTWTRKISIE
jgi:hypothetical protein